MKECIVDDEEEKEDFLTDEFVRKIINETIEFDKKLNDPEFLRKVRIEEEKIRNIDLSALIEGVKRC